MTTDFVSKHSSNAPRRTLLLAAAFGAIGLQLACSDGSQPGSGAPAPTEQTDGGTVSTSDDASAASPDAQAVEEDSPQVAAYCAALASHNACSGSTGACSASSKCLMGKMLPTSADAFNQCYRAPSCKTSDKCLVVAGQAAVDPGASSFQSDCVARVSDCAGSFAKDKCSVVVFAFPGGGAAAEACIAKECGEIQGCFKALENSLQSCSP